jgi:hypothetical protein
MARRPSYGMRGKKWSPDRIAWHAAKFGDHMSRFTQRVEYDTTGGCWLWSGTMVPSTGYGQLSINGKGVSAHRLSWSLFFGEIPEGIIVCHKCDVRACVNPAHLFLGTWADNMADMKAKGRVNRKRGEAVSGAKLRSADIPLILQLLDDGESCKRIADSFGITDGAINAIRRGKSWSHVTGITPAAREGVTLERKEAA